MNVFDLYSKEYDEWYEKNKFAYLSEIEALKKVVPKKAKGLEIGVGTGRFAEPLGVSVGIDPSEKMLEIAKKRRITTFTGYGENLPFADEEFDYVLIVITICFVDNPDKVIFEAKRVLKDKGKLIIGIIDKNSHLGKFYQEKKKQGHRFYKEANFYSADEIIELLKKHNFNEITTYQTIFQPIESLKKNRKTKKRIWERWFCSNMRKQKLKYIYGPVFSWRLGISLGIDPISCKNKICTFDCIYCQLGKTKVFSSERKVYVSVENLVEEINSLADIKIDYMTFSGRGEPTLAKNLGEMIKLIKGLRKEKIAVITNSSLIAKKDVVEDLLLADFVIAKLDAYSQESLEIINRPMKQITFNTILDGIKQFKSRYKGKFALQIMFIEENKNNAKELAALVKEIKPDEVQINTPLRPCNVKPLSKEEIFQIKEYFKDMNTISVYDIEKKHVVPISTEDTIKRRGKI